MRGWIILTFAAAWLAGVCALPSTTHRPPYHMALERRTDQPPERKLSKTEFKKKEGQARHAMHRAFRNTVGLEQRVKEILGHKSPGPIPQEIDNAELNNALRQLRYPGPYYPERHELADDSERATPEMEAQTKRVYRELEKFMKEPGFAKEILRRVGVNYQPNTRVEDIPSPLEEPWRWNQALREMGWPGELFVEWGPRPPDSDSPPSPDDPPPDQGGGSGGRGFGGSRNPRRPNRSPDEGGSFWSQLLPMVKESLGHYFLGGGRSNSHSTDPPSRFNIPPFPITAPRGAGRLIR